MSISGNVAALIAVLGLAVGIAGVTIACVAWVRVRRVRDAQRMLIGGPRNWGSNARPAISTP